MAESSIPITGNTYPVKDALKALGGKWDNARKAWMVPVSKASEAERLVKDAPIQDKSAKTFKRRSRGTWTGCSCGSVEEYEKDSDCFSCRHDR